MDLRDLRYFETIAQLQHMGRAAAKLHRSQPALTGCIRRLEKDCGAMLLEKAGRGIRLTQAGKALLKWAQRMRFNMEDAHSEITAIGQGLAGQVRIGIVPTAARFLLPSVARALLQEAPKVTLSVTVGLIETIQPLLRTGEVDMLIATEGRPEAGYTSKLLAEDFIVVAASTNHALFHGTVPTLKDLTSYQWALQPPGAPTRDWLDHAFDSRRLPRPQVQVEASMLLILPALIVQTGLLSFITRHHLEEHGKKSGLKEVPIKEATMRRRLVVTYRDDSYMSAAATRLIELFSELHGSS